MAKIRRKRLVCKRRTLYGERVVYHFLQCLAQHSLLLIGAHCSSPVVIFAIW